MTTPCCCTGATKPTCNYCIESSDLFLDDIGFIIDGSQFSTVTDVYPPGFIIPSGCVNPVTGHSTACADALNREWNLYRYTPGHTTEAGVDDCVDYFYDSVACDAVTCWWLDVGYSGCPNLCNPTVPDGDSVICRGGDEISTIMVVDASTDPDYVILAIQVTISYPRNRCCLTNGTYTGGPYYKMRVFYRVLKTNFTCLCNVCFEKYDEQLLHGDGVDGFVYPCLTFPDNIQVTPRPVGATPEMLAAANALCSDPDYPPNVACANGGPGCGETACSYTADADKIWQLSTGICINGCVCPDNNALIAAGYPRAKYVGQKFIVTIGCVPGDRPCSELLGRCCSKDSDGENVCTDNISECDCYLLTGGCWTIGGGIDCDNPTTGECKCAPIVGLCCYTDEAGDHCLDNVTHSYCNGLDGSWVEQNEAGDFSCAGDRGGLTGCGDVCVGDCTYFPVEDLINGGYPWTIIDQTCPMTPQCTCPNEAPTTGPGAIPPATMEQWEAGTRVTTGCDGRLPPAGRMMATAPTVAVGSSPAPAAKRAPTSPLVYLEPVGDKLHELLKECGINRPVCGECARWRRMMNEWGCDKCDKDHRPEIIERLAKEAKAGTWLEAIKVASGGYFSTTALLNEAIRRASATANQR